MGTKIVNNPQLACVLLLVAAPLLSSWFATATTAYSLNSGAATSCIKGDIACQVGAQLPDEDQLPFDLELHRRILAGNSIGYPSILNGNRPACNPNCGNPGTSYTGNHCTYQNHCGQ